MAYIVGFDSYFSGSAPFALLSLKLRQSEWGNHFQVSFCQKPLFACLMEHCRISYGGMLRAAIAIYGDTPETKIRLFNEIVGEEPSARLVREGVLMLTV